MLTVALLILVLFCVVLFILVSVIDSQKERIVAQKELIDAQDEAIKAQDEEIEAKRKLIESHEKAKKILLEERREMIITIKSQENLIQAQHYRIEELTSKKTKKRLKGESDEKKQKTERKVNGKEGKI